MASPHAPFDSFEHGVADVGGDAARCKKTVYILLVFDRYIITFRGKAIGADIEGENDSII